MRHGVIGAGLLATVAIVSPAQAQNARDILMDAAYASPDKTTAQARIGRAIAAADAALKRNPRDHEARLQRALAISYRGKLTRTRADLIAARRDFEAVVAAEPRNPEAQLALAGWHLGAVIELGPMMARTVLGARKATGIQALDRALALGADRASIVAMASLFRIQLDHSDIAGARRLAEAATRAGGSTAFDRLMQKQAATLLVSLRKGNGKASAAAAERLMPFGRFDT
jgi:tetratricopeptide (TPR) repeat protein